MKIKMNDICDQVIGKVLLSLAYSDEYKNKEEASKAGDRWVPRGFKIRDAWIGITEGDCDPCLWMELDDPSLTEVYAYDSETIELADKGKENEGQGVNKG